MRDTDASLNTTSAEINAARNSVTLRAFVVGLLLSLGIAALNCWIETLANVHFVGGVQMPFGAIFSLFFFILAVNLPLRLLARSASPVGMLARRFFPPFAAAELLTVYAMMLFGALVSTPGADNLFLTVAPALFYFGTRENRWAETFYQHVPSWFAPGWDGQTYRREVIEPLYIGGLSIAEIPWHAWTAMILAWSVLLLLAYATLFWTALLFRRQWIENEVLAFPLVQLPLQMVEVDEHDAHPPARAFWTNRAMWAGFVLALSFHFLRGMNNFFPDWPTPAAFQGGPTRQVTFAFTEKPWLALGAILVQVYLGGIGIAYLLTRELSLSFWVFFLLARFQLVLAEMLGFPADSLTKGPYVPFGGRALPIFIEFQTIGGWLMTALLLVWTARLHLLEMWREAITPHSKLRMHLRRSYFHIC